MLQTIRQIITGIDVGYVFDDHFIIQQLIKHHSDVYLDYAANINTNSNRTLVVHGNIGQLVASFDNDLVRRVPDLAWSENIHGNPSRCTCWVRI